MASPEEGILNRSISRSTAPLKYYVYGEAPYGPGPTLPRPRAASNGWTRSKILYVPLAAIVLLTLTGLWGYNKVFRHASVASKTTISQIRHGQAELEQQNISAAIQALNRNQEKIMAILRNITHAGVLASTAGQQHQQEEQQQSSAKEAVPAVTDAARSADVPAAIVALPMLTKLHNAVLRSSKDFHQHRQTMQQLLDKLVHMEASAAEEEVSQQLQQQHPPLQQFVHELYKLLLASGRLIPCREDTTLAAGDAIPWPSSSSSSSSDASINSSSSSFGDSEGSSGGSPKYYFAANLRDNSVQMPQFVLSLLQTLLRLPHGTAIVSVYESNSDDGVHGWIDVLQLALNVIGTPNRLVARGMLVRTDEQYRIEFLSQVRNMAMAPLYTHYAETRHRTAPGTGSGSPSSSGSSSSSSGSGSSSPSSSSSRSPGSPGSSSPGSSSSSKPAAPGVLPWDPNYVVFMNDVYFCWSMVLRLISYRADITCGMDFWQNKDATVSLPVDQRSKQHLPKPAGIPAEYRLESPLADAMSPDQENPIVFYDVWVARDVAGGKLWWTYPFIADGASSEVVSKGLPVRASCCWNGLVVLAAEPFRQGVRFRTHNEDGECRASECTFICEDFARLGYERVVIDAGVQVAYDWGLAREMMSVGIEGVGQSTWSQAKAAGIAEAHRRPAYHSMECCSLQPGAKWVHFYTDCSRRDIMQRNYTAESLEMNTLIR